MSSCQYGVLTELESVGMADSHFINKPSYSLFRKAFRQHENFAVDWNVRDQFEGQGDTLRASITKKGDLCIGAGIVVDQRQLQGCVPPRFFTADIDYELHIGGHCISDGVAVSDLIHTRLNRRNQDTDHGNSLPVARQSIYFLNTFFSSIGQAMPLHTIQDIEIEIDVDGLFDNKMVSQVISFPPPVYQFGYNGPKYTIALKTSSGTEIARPVTNIKDLVKMINCHPTEKGPSTHGYFAMQIDRSTCVVTKIGDSMALQLEKGPDETVLAEIKDPVVEQITRDMLLLQTFQVYVDDRTAAKQRQDFPLVQMQLTEDIMVGKKLTKSLHFNLPITEVAFDCDVSEDAQFTLTLNGNNRISLPRGLLNQIYKYIKGSDADPNRTATILFGLQDDEDNFAGAFNMSKVEHVQLIIEDKTKDDDEKTEIEILATNYNILRYENGAYQLLYSD